MPRYLEDLQAVLLMHALQDSPSSRAFEVRDELSPGILATHHTHSAVAPWLARLRIMEMEMLRESTIRFLVRQPKIPHR